MTSHSGLTCSFQELLEYQRCLPKKFPPKRLKSQQAGQDLSSIRGRGMDFSEVRAYQPGDDIRHMEWRVTARTGEPHIKLYHEEKERPVFIVADYNPSMYFGTRVAFKSVIMSRFAAMLGFAASHHGDKVGGIVYSGNAMQDIRPRGRKQGVLPLIKQLSLFSCAKPSLQSKSMDEILLQLRQVVKPGALIFLLSDFENLGGAFDAHLRKLCLHADVVCYLVSDPLERQAPKPGKYQVTDGKEQMVLDTHSEKLCHLYNQHYQEKQKKLSGLVKPGRLVGVSTDDDLEQHLQLAFMSFKDWRQT